MSEPAASEPEAKKAPAGNVTVLEHEGRTFTIVGTAHVSRDSVDEVRRVIGELKPDTVCVELDPVRYDALRDETRWRKLDIFQVIKEKKVLFLMASLALAAYQRRMGEALGVKPGAELLAAVEKAEEVGSEVVLADRDIQATLKRTWHNLSFWSKTKVIAGLMGGAVGGEELTEEQIEQLKEKDVLSEAMAEFARVLPQVKEPLIDERDQYLMSSITDAPGKRVVAVVGAGHVEGMTQWLGKPVDRDKLAEIPKPSPWGKLLKWVIPAIVLAAFYYGWRDRQGEGLEEMIFAWLIPNMVGAAVLTLLAGGKLLTVLVALLASPITSLNPTIGAGMVAGLVEAWLRKPTVEDCEHINEDSTEWRGFYKNPVLRVLLVTVGATLGSAAGAWIGASWVVSLL